MKTSVGTAAVAGVLNAPTQSQERTSAKAREYYELRQYHVQSGRQQKLTDAFLKDALVPALNRLGIAPVGVFNLTIGPVTPMFYVLIAAAAVETLATVEARLGQDAEYLKIGAPFLTSPADQAPFIRIKGLQKQYDQALEFLIGLADVFVQVTARRSLSFQEATTLPLPRTNPPFAPKSPQFWTHFGRDHKSSREVSQPPYPN